MPQVMPWWCPYTEQFFPTREHYRAHLRILGHRLLQQRRLAIMAVEVDHAFAEFRKCATLEEIKQWIISHSGVFFQNNMVRRPHSVGLERPSPRMDWRRRGPDDLPYAPREWGKTQRVNNHTGKWVVVEDADPAPVSRVLKDNEAFRIVDMHFTNMRWFDGTDRPHHRPLNAKWDTTAPRPYWRGGASITVNACPVSFFSDLFDGSGLSVSMTGHQRKLDDNTSEYEINVTMFCEDWLQVLLHSRLTDCHNDLARREAV